MITLRTVTGLALAAAALGLVAAPAANAAPSSIVSINFGSDATGGAGGTTTLAATATAGVVPAANFNNVPGFGNASGPLNNSTGAVTAITESNTATDTFTSGSAALGTPDGILNNGFIETGGAGPAYTVTLNGLSATDNYSLYVLTSTDGGARTANYSIGTNVQTVNQVKFNGTYAQGVNYALFSNLTGSAFLTLTAAATTPNDGFPRASITGLQLIDNTPAVPEASSSIGLGLMLALGGLVVIARKKSLRA